MDQGRENPLRQQELSLRNQGLASFAELGILNDKYDSIDLTNNFLTSLSDIPTLAGPLTRLSTLILANNRITEITSDIASKVPNLHSLSLANNKITDWESLQFVKQLSNLKHLVISGNPIATGDYRQKLRQLQPNLKYIDFAVTKLPKMPKISKENQQRVAELLKQLDDATNMQEVEKIEAELASLAH